MHHLKKHKKDALKKKFNTYHRHVSKYNVIFGPDHIIPLPKLETIETAPITDPFWDGGPVSHPDELWATDEDTKSGIQAFLMQRSAKEELRRIGSEARQLILWAIEYEERVERLKHMPVVEGEFLKLNIKTLATLLTKIATCEGMKDPMNMGNSYTPG